MLIIFAKIADWLRRPRSQLMEVTAFIEDLAENASSIIYFEEKAALKKSIVVCNDAFRILLIGTYSRHVGQRLVIWVVYSMFD